MSIHHRLAGLHIPKDLLGRLETPVSGLARCHLVLCPSFGKACANRCPNHADLGCGIQDRIP